MGYRLNRLDKSVFMAVPKPMLTEFSIHYRLESCDQIHFRNMIVQNLRLLKLFVGFLPAAGPAGGPVPDGGRPAVTAMDG